MLLADARVADGDSALLLFMRELLVELLDPGADAGEQGSELTLETLENIEGVAVGFDRLFNSLASSTTTDGGGFRPCFFRGLLSLLCRFLDDLGGPELRLADKVVSAELGVGFLPGLGDDHLRFLIGADKDLLPVVEDVLGVCDGCRDGGANLIDEIEQAIAIDGNAAAEPRPPPGEQRLFELIDELQDIDKGFLKPVSSDAGG